MHFPSLLHLCLTIYFVLGSVGLDILAEREEYCNQGNLCLTNFNWCQLRVVDQTGSNYTTGACDTKDIDHFGRDGFYRSSATGTTAGVTVFYYDIYNLTWTGADPDYPVLVNLSFGPSAELTNGTKLEWTTNVTGSMLSNFRFFDMFYNLSQDTSTRFGSVVGYAQGWPASFTVSQPERPTTAGISTTDTSNSFYISLFDLQNLNRRYDARIEDLQSQQHHKWSLGVGVGVGVGVPLLLLAAYILGQSRGRKLRQESLHPAPNSEKRVSDDSSI